MAVYVHYGKKGPDFTWDQAKVTALLAEVRYRQGRLLGRMEGLAERFRREAQRKLYLRDVRILGDGRLASIFSAAAREYAAPLTGERLAQWHAELAPPIPSAARSIKVHYQVAAAHGQEGKLTKLVHWVNSATEIDPVLKAAVAQVWLMTARPFEQGNERLGELVMEWLLVRANEGGERLYSVTAQMQAERASYDAIVAKIRQSPTDVTAWIEWFLGCLDRAIAVAGDAMGGIRQKEIAWARCAGMPLNERQRMVLEKLIDRTEGENSAEKRENSAGESTVTSSEWASWTKTSQDTAGRDINDLVRRGVLTRLSGGGRSTSYAIVEFK
jgi:hypothetical protein